MNARLHIVTGLREGKTFLKNCFFTTPFKIADVTENKNDSFLQLMLMTSSPGILDGDKYDVKIELAEGCALQLHTQSYQRLFQMKKGASQKMEVLMHNNASFRYLPHPAVPHRESNFVTKNKIHLSEGCKLIWGEVLTCGRKLNGEEFVFTKYQNLTEIFLNGKLAVKENLLIVPSGFDIKSIGQLQEFTHQASLIYIDGKATINDLILETNKILSTEKDVCFGISALPINGAVVRMLGHKAEQLYNCLQQLANLFSAEAVGRIK